MVTHSVDLEMIFRARFPHRFFLCRILLSEKFNVAMVAPTHYITLLDQIYKFLNVLLTLDFDNSKRTQVNIYHVKGYTNCDEQ